MTKEKADKILAMSRLFHTGSDHASNAIIENDWDAYTYGYKASADHLVEIAINDLGNVQDAIVFPIVFLYRQYLELEVKKLIHDCQFSLGISVDVVCSHRLDQLWMSCSDLLQQAHKGVSAENLKTIEARFAEFTQIDPTSTAFRYPLDKLGRPSVTAIAVIDLSQLRRVMDEVAGFLENCEEDLGELFAAVIDESFQEEENI